MDQADGLAERFQAHHTRLRAVAYQMLGSLSEADDAVQEAWLRVRRAGTGGVGNLGGWLTTVVARVCLDMLRSRKAQREEPLGPEPISNPQEGIEQEALLADTVGLALHVVLQTLAPAERVAFALHDMFDLPFDEIGPIVGRSPTAARQLASRARRRVQGGPTVPEAELTRQRAVDLDGGHDWRHDPSSSLWHVLSHRLWQVRHCDDGPRRGHVTATDADGSG